jgi:hypothetical protein
MYKHMSCWALLLATLVLAQGHALMAADPSLVGQWLLNEGDGDVSLDQSNGGIDASLLGDPTWETDPERGTVLTLDGTDDFVFITGPYELETYTVSVWFRFDGTPGGTFDIASIYGMSAHIHGILLELRSEGIMRYLHRAQPMGTGGGTTAYTTDTYDDGAWYHMAAVKTADTMTLYMNGEVALTASDSTVFEEPVQVVLGRLGENNGARSFVGALSDFRIYDRALAENEIPSTMVNNTTSASSANPPDGESDVLRDVTLTWAPGESALTHKVYFGTSFEDLNTASADVLVSDGQDANSFDAGVLTFGQTYYWRVDEVNGAPDYTVFAGDVWSFAVEPFSIPVETVSASASSFNANMGPGNTINGIGLNDLDQHSTDGTDMWLSGMGDATPSIQYEFDKVYKLDKLLVWNSNQMIEAFVGLGAKDVLVEYSADGVEWMALADATQFSQATGAATYTANTSVDFGGALAKHVKITVNAGYGMLPQFGLSEVRFYYIPTNVREPQPAHGAGTARANVVLNWRAGREAASHQVYLGTDAADLPMVATTEESSYDAGALDYGVTYYWQIAEVNEAETPSSYAGPIWSFSTPAFGTVESFDQYDDNCNRIFFAWEDGLGHSGGEDIEGCDVPASNGNGGGSIVGNNSAPFAEQSTVYAGGQSLPLDYDNAFGPSEATLTLDGQDWTASGVRSLSLMFFGQADNSGQLYVKINNSKIAYDGAAEDIKASLWQAWIIDLSALSGLQSVRTLTIGVEGASAAGKLYIDAVRLYPLAGELVVPAAPSADGLVAHLGFDEGSGASAADSSGNNNHGDVMGDAQWVAGKVGGALAFDGVDDMVVVKQNSGLPIYNNGTDNAFSVAMWVKGGPQNDMRVFSEGSTSSNNPLYNLGTQNAGATGQFDVYIRPTGMGHTLSMAEPFDDTWHHIAWVDENGAARLYVDGHLDAGDFSYTRATMDLNTTSIGGILRAAPSHFFTGQIDELRIYNRVLSQAEVAGLAGKTAPFAKPF